MYMHVAVYMYMYMYMCVAVYMYMYMYVYLIDHSGQLVTVHPPGWFGGSVARQGDVTNGGTHAKLNHLTIGHLRHLI